MFFGIRLKFGTLGLLLIILSSFAISACGGSTESGAGSSATTIITATAPLSGSGTYLVSWDAVADSRVTGYKLYYSTRPLDQGTAQAVHVGDITSYSFDPAAAGIAAGATMYLAVAAVGGGVESAMSTPVSVVVQ